MLKPMYEAELMACHVGHTYTFKGPGLCYAGGWYTSFTLRDQYVAEELTRVLSRVYEAGRQSMAKDVRELLGVRK